jgi:glutathione S-transferase
MGNPVLVIGNKNYSSWSLRPWILLSTHGIAFDEVCVPLYQQGSKVAIQAHAPAGRTPYGKVPILRDGATTVWDSLAICEYAAERWPSIHGWPADITRRAHARAISAEMHAGFATLRSEMPMNCRRERAPVTQGAQLQGEIDRVTEIWTSCRKAASGSFLFGAFGIADAMYAPVVLRFTIYQVSLPAVAQAYVDTMLALPSMQKWIEGALDEPDVLTQFER